MKKNLSLMLITSIFIVGTIIALISKISLYDIVKNYNYNVIIILISMELFTNLLCKVGIIEKIAIYFSAKSQGDKRKCIIYFGLLMFIISAFLNNITAVLMILPIIFVLFKTIGISQKYLNIFLAVILALSNTGGAASPIGDFPAIVIMSSGITTFIDYLIRAFPFFVFTSIILILYWILKLKKENQSNDLKLFSIELLENRYKFFRINKCAMFGIIFILILMLLVWSFIPSNIVPSELVAIIGFVLAMSWCSINNVKVELNVDFKSILTISSFMYLASIISSTGILDLLVNILQNNINNPKTLLIVIMVFTSIISGMFGAGSAATAIMPIIINLSNTTLSSANHWLAIAYAASICAGSSLFMWSATAGFVLSKKIDDTNLIDNDAKLTWKITDYLKYGIQNYLIQLITSISIIYLIV